MTKIIKGAVVIFLAIILLQVCVLYRQKQHLSDSLIRVHVVGNSNTLKDQSIKLAVKDAVTSYLQTEISNITVKNEAMDYLSSNLDTVSQIATKVLRENNFSETVSVCLAKEAFDQRDYETFSLPAGIYDSLRINIGEAQGKNWWCVAFPSLCVPATREKFIETAVHAGIPEEMCDCLANPQQWNIRFFILERLGKLEIFLDGK